VATPRPVTGVPTVPVRSDVELVPELRELVRDNAERLFGLAPDELRLERLTLSRPLHRRAQRHHRMLTVRWSAAGDLREKRIWLKFVTYVRDRYDVHVRAWEQTRDVGVFPQPYFYGEWDGGGAIGMEVVDGASLRDLFLRHALTRRSAQLGTVFAALGASLRAFHDSSQPSGSRSVGQLEETVTRAVLATDRLTADERKRALERIAAAVARAGGGATQLPSIPVHHDCVLRNVVVRPTGAPCLVDLDSMRAAWKSRWYDVAALLINVESQIKFAPFADARSIVSAWGSFWGGYAAAGLPDGLLLEQAQALLYLIKVERLFHGPWRPLYEIHTGFADTRYIRRLNASLLDGRHLVLGSDARDAA
jgi:Phosphotransferase enzyme family